MLSVLLLAGCATAEGTGTASTPTVTPATQEPEVSVPVSPTPGAGEGLAAPVQADAPDSPTPIETQPSSVLGYSRSQLLTACAPLIEQVHPGMVIEDGPARAWINTDGSAALEYVVYNQGTPEYPFYPVCNISGADPTGPVATSIGVPDL
jgi:hypothetical protein